ncbi:hypothetical protein KC316_g1931 [Hortaea werneckii]|nr:hypothetical protein KC324_g4054 [Hortaea werneckii]KAI7593108.1 hypothetical protein KC316_g1931 [Hortaea werneckii]
MSLPQLPVIPATITKAATDPQTNFSVTEGQRVHLLKWDTNNEDTITKGFVLPITGPVSGLNLGGGWIPKAAIQLYPQKSGEKGLPCVAKNDWIPRPSNHWCTRLFRGERGQVLKWDGLGFHAWVEFPDRTNSSGLPRYAWVDSSQIEVGINKPYGSYNVRNKNMLSEINVDVALEVRGQRSKPERCLLAIMESFAQNKQRIPLLLDRVWPLIKGPREREVAAQKIMSGIQAAHLLQIFNNDRSSIDDIATAGWSADVDSGSGAGIYARIYDRIRRQNEGKVYTGSTVDFPERAHSHADKLKNKRFRETAHSKAFNNATRRWIVVLCELNRDDQPLLLLAEQLLVIMIGTYDDIVLSKLHSKEPSTIPSLPPVNETMLHQLVAQDQEADVDPSVINPAEIELAKLISEEESISEEGGRGSRWRAMRDTAAQIMTAAEKAMAQVGWTPFLKRGSRYTGLNIQSPLATNAGCIIWTRVEIPGKMEIFRRPSRKCLSKANSNYLGQIGGKPPACIEFYCEKDKEPPVDASVFLVCEITRDGSPHPEQWAHLPSICRYTDADRARTLAIRVEWVENNKWKSKYLHNKNHPATNKKRANDPNAEEVEPGAIWSIGHAIAIINLLHRKEITKNFRSFDTHLGHARILEVTFDHLKQEVLLEESTTPRTGGRTGAPKTKETLIAELKAMGFENVDAPRKQRRDNSGMDDRCYLEKNRIESDYTCSSAACKQVGDENVCEPCEQYGMPWSFTPINKLRGPEGQKMRHAIWFPKAGEGAIESFQDPIYQMGQINEAPSDDHPSPSAWVWSSLASGSRSVPQATFPIGSHASLSAFQGSGVAGSSGQGTASTSTSTPTHSRTVFVPAPFATPSLPDRRGTSGSGNRGTGDGGQVIAPGRPRAASVQTPTGALRQSSMNRFFAQSSSAVPQIPLASPSVGPSTGSPSGRGGSSGSGHRTTGSGGRFIAPGHARHSSAQTPTASRLSGSGNVGTGDGGQFIAPGHVRHSSAQTASGSRPTSLILSGSAGASGSSGSGSRATRTLGQAQSATGPSSIRPPLMPFNRQYVEAMLQQGGISDLESASRIIIPHAQQLCNLSTARGAEIARYLTQLRDAAYDMGVTFSYAPSLDPASQDLLNRSSDIHAATQQPFTNMWSNFAMGAFVDRQSQQIRNRLPDPGEVRIYINRHVVGANTAALGHALYRYIEDAFLALRKNPAQHLQIVREALARPGRPQFFKPATQISVNALPTNDAYLGDVLPTIPGSSDYLVDRNGVRLSSRQAVLGHATALTTPYLQAYFVGNGQSENYLAQIRTEFTRLRELYQFTASPHLILVADYYDQIVQSVGDRSLWTA